MKTGLSKTDKIIGSILGVIGMAVGLLILLTIIHIGEHIAIALHFKWYKHHYNCLPIHTLLCKGITNNCGHISNNYK